jgi:hypothetical protein
MSSKIRKESRKINTLNGFEATWYTTAALNPNPQTLDVYVGLSEWFSTTRYLQDEEAGCATAVRPP